MMEADAPLLPLLASVSSLVQDETDLPDGPPPSLKITQASRSTWSTLFRKYIVTAPRVGDADDLLFFVRHPITAEEPFYALRNDSKSLPPPEAADVNWEETCYLNVLMHNMEYTMEVSVRQRKFSAIEGKFVSTNMKKLSKKVYAAPNHIRLDSASKAENVELTYPFIYFRIDDYEDVWREIQLEAPDQLVAVELFAHAPLGGPGHQQCRHRLFSGALSFEAIVEAVKEKVAGWSLTAPPASHFFKLRGPRGKGSAQLCVKLPHADAPDNWATNLFKQIVNPAAYDDVKGPFVCNITWLSVSCYSIMRDMFRQAAA